MFCQNDKKWSSYFNNRSESRKKCSIKTASMVAVHAFQICAIHVSGNELGGELKTPLLYLIKRST